MKTIPRLLAHAVLACAAGTANADALDEHKLRFLSCDTRAADKDLQRRAGEWLQGFAKASQDGKTTIAGPVELGKACLKNVVIEAGPGAYMVRGEICNARLDDFTDALAAIGTKLDKDAEKPIPTAVMGLKKGDGEREYAITKGMWDFQSGRPVRGSSEYAFMCGASAGGPQ